MSKALPILGVLAVFTVPLLAQDGTFTFNMGGGVSTPLNPTAQYAGTSGNFVAGAGLRLNKKNSVIGEFMWSGLPPSVSILHPVNAPFGNVNLYSLTANYRYDLSNLGGSRFGLYTIAGGGWYYRYASVDKNYVAPPGTACQPIYTWWGYACSGGYVYTATVASKGASAGGVNGGVGFTIRIKDSPWNFYTEARYHYAFHSGIASTVLPVTLGLRYH